MGRRRRHPRARPKTGGTPTMIKQSQTQTTLSPTPQSPHSIVVMGGSFNPPTLAHQKLLLAAVDAVGADLGVFVPSAHAYVKNKMRRANSPHEVLPESLRLEMLQAMAADDPRLTVDDLEYHRTEKGYTYETLEALQTKYPQATLYFLAGGDKVDVIPRWHRIPEFLDRFSILVVRRNGSDPQADIDGNPFLSRYRDRFSIVQAPPGIEGISSSLLRERLRQEDPAAEALCHPKAWALLQAYRAENKPTIPSFSKEYRFLSNFWEAPVTYEGVTYLNNEAAFQAQKCLDPNDRPAFAQLNPSKAKRLGRQVALRPDWEQVKIPIMTQIVRAKFTQNEALKQQLLATGNLILEEGNTWHDTFWGVDSNTRQGENHLGKILMAVREELAGTH